MANNSDEIIAQLADELHMPLAALTSLPALEKFRNRDISEIPISDQERLRAVVRENIRALLLKRQVNKGIVEATTPDLIERALFDTREQILADKTVSDVMRGFIADHCIC